MLVLTRKTGERILIGEDIYLTVIEVRGESIRIGIDAPRGVQIQRGEIVSAVAAANIDAATADDTTESDLRGILGSLTNQRAEGGPAE